MFWALVSPLRHTSQPPRLAPTSPLRILFEKHGAAVSRHPALFIVLSAALSVTLSYPSLFLYFYGSPGPSSVTHHVWTSATPFMYPTAIPDIGIKQAWIQGSYMEALTNDVLKEGLKIQQALLSEDALCSSLVDDSYYDVRHGSQILNGGGQSALKSPLSTTGMFFHSPLLYWNCSMGAVEQDRRILKTVNDNISRRSSARITLRLGSVFAGKQFSHQKLIAADALVISLFYDLNSTAGELWDQRAEKLAKEARVHERYRVYPHNGQDNYSTLYEFRYQPMSSFDIFTLSAGYICVGVYLAVSLRRLRAVKSRFGLVITVLTQICTTIMSTFSILAFLKVPVSHVPREVFPFVIIVIGLENMFRLINAVLAAPVEQPATIRISSALGEVGFLSSVAVGTDLVILAVIGSLSVPAVREFCMFAGVALLMDFIWHMTFFLAVLSVDVRRLERNDSLDRLMHLASNGDSDANPGPSSKKTDGVIEFLFQGGSPLSTRIAGSAIMICFAVALNMHFLDNQHPLKTFEILGNKIRNPARFAQDSLSHDMPLNVARSPSTWLSRQDEFTGMELIQATKPGAVRIIAKAYNPLFFVLAGSDRARIPGKMPNIISSIDIDVLQDHLQAFFLTVVVVIAGVTLLMNYLLLSDIPEDLNELSKDEGPLLKSYTLVEGHSLDVAMLASALKGILVSIGLDRRVVMWKLKNNCQPLTKEYLRPLCAEQVLWPIRAVALDENGEWLAIAPRSGKISFYRLDQSPNLFRSLHVDVQDHQPSAFFFAPRNLNERHYEPRLIVVRSDGWLYEVYIRSTEIVRHSICGGVEISSSHGIITPRLPLRIVTACQRGRIFVTAKSAGEWYTEQLDLMAPPSTSPVMEPGEPCGILPLSALGMVISSRSCNVELVDLLSGSIIRSFQTGQFKPSSLRAFHAKRRTCLYCGCPAVLSFSIAYTEKESGMFMMHTFSSAKGKMRDICLRAERDRRERKCSGFESVVETTHWLDNVEGWEPTDLNMVAGIQRRELPQEQSLDDYESPIGSASLRRRKKRDKKVFLEDEDEWEAWTMDANGVVASYPLHDEANFGDGLLVSRAGPVTKIGPRSIAVGFGNNIKILQVGNERFEDEDGVDLYHTPARRARIHRR